MKNSIQFLAESQARLLTDLEKLKDVVQAVTVNQARTDAQINSLVKQMREGFNNLIVANEVTRDLAAKVGELAMQTSQRVTSLEDKNGKP